MHARGLSYTRTIAYIEPIYVISINNKKTLNKLNKTDIKKIVAGTNKGWWEYKKSKIFMIKDVPIEISLLVFSLMAGITFILFSFSIY